MNSRERKSLISRHRSENIKQLKKKKETLLQKSVEGCWSACRRRWRKGWNFDGWWHSSSQNQTWRNNSKGKKNVWIKTSSGQVWDKRHRALIHIISLTAQERIQLLTTLLFCSMRSQQPGLCSHHPHNPLNHQNLLTTVYQLSTTGAALSWSDLYKSSRSFQVS